MNEQLPIMEEQLKLSFEFASDLAKQLITISSGILALSITFLKDVLGYGKDSSRQLQIKLLKGSWLLLLISIIAGIWSLSALTGSLAPLDLQLDYKPELGFNSRFPAGIQVVTFVLGIVFMVLFGWKSLRNNN